MIPEKKQNGGPGRGQGRRKGEPNKRTLALRAVADRALLQGETPLDVMLDNMLAARNRVKVLIAKSLALGKRLLEEQDPVKIKEINDALFLVERDEMAMRSLANEWAGEAAPYSHPRLASVQFRGRVDGKVTLVHEGMTPQEAADAYVQSMRADPVAGSLSQH